MESNTNTNMILSDISANIFTISGVLAFIAKITPILTIILIATGIIVNTIKIMDRFKKKKSDN
jgi:preprotein translocase subunit SecG